MKTPLWKIIFPTLILLVSFLNSEAQIQTSGVPWTVETNHFIKTYSSIEIQQAPENWENLLEMESPAMKPFLFAWPVDTLINVVKPANRIYSDNAIEVYQLSVYSEFAYSINLIFDSYKLPTGTELYLYDPKREQTWGAYTAINNKRNGKLATSPIPGNEIVIELVVDKRLKEFDPQLSISRISLDQKDAFGFKNRFGRSGDCNVDINCPQGADWQVIKRSVCKFIRGGTFLCSGALINNTANDGRPLLLTANHCIASENHASTSVFYFNYESLECYGVNGRLDHSISSSELLATTNKLDFALVELSITPPERFNPYYAGWDRNPVYPDTVTCIHHPSGDVKKISVANIRVATGTFGGGYDAGTHWWIKEWDVGTTEGGSSGSPLFNTNFKIIGDLTGGDAKCSYNFNDYFQKFHISWDRYPDPGDQLKVWLDPENEDPLVWNGLDPFSEGKPAANFSYLPEEPKVGQYIRLRDVSSGSPLEWNWSFKNASSEKSSAKNPIAIYDESGIKEIILIVGNDNGSDTIRQSVFVSDRIDFTANERKLVRRSDVDFTSLTTGNPHDIEWSIQEGIQIWNSSSSNTIQSYSNIGENDLQLEVTYAEKTLKFFHQDFIKVIPEALIFAGELRSQYSDKEPLGIIRLGTNGLIPGTNSLGYEAFANSFYRGSDTSAIINGVVVEILEMDSNDEPVYLNAGVWDEEWNLLRMDSILLDPKSMPFRVTIWFDQALGMDTLVYAGIEIPENEGLVFSTGLTMTRNENDDNSAWGRKGDDWSLLSQAIGLNSALGIKLETSNLYQDFKSQIKVLESNNYGSLKLDLGNLVFEDFELDIYNMEGKKMISTSNYSGNILNIDANITVSGVYLLQLRLDNLSFTKKVLMLSHR